MNENRRARAGVCDEKGDEEEDGTRKRTSWTRRRNRKREEQGDEGGRKGRGLGMGAVPNRVGEAISPRALWVGVGSGARDHCGERRGCAEGLERKGEVQGELEAAGAHEASEFGQPGTARVLALDLDLA